MYLIERKECLIQFKKNIYRRDGKDFPWVDTNLLLALLPPPPPPDDIDQGKFFRSTYNKKKGGSPLYWFLTCDVTRANPIGQSTCKKSRAWPFFLLREVPFLGFNKSLIHRISCLKNISTLSNVLKTSNKTLPKKKNKIDKIKIKKNRIFKIK